MSRSVKNIKKHVKNICIGLTLGFVCGSVVAEESPVFSLVIKDHKFIPDTLRVPKDKKITLIVDNQDATPEEFESSKLDREKIIKGNSKATILLSPLKAGEYEFEGEFNADTAKGKIIAQ